MKLQFSIRLMRHFRFELLSYWTSSYSWQWNADSPSWKKWFEEPIIWWENCVSKINGNGSMRMKRHMALLKKSSINYWSSTRRYVDFWLQQTFTNGSYMLLRNNMWIITMFCFPECITDGWKFVSLRLDRLAYFFRIWRREAYKCRREGLLRDVTEMIVGFLMSSLGSSYVEHRKAERNIFLHNNCVSLLLALHCWHGLCNHIVSASGSNWISKNYRRKKFNFRLRLRIASYSAAMLIFCWRKVTRKWFWL